MSASSLLRVNSSKTFVLHELVTSKYLLKLLTKLLFPMKCFSQQAKMPIVKCRVFDFTKKYITFAKDQAGNEERLKEDILLTFLPCHVELAICKIVVCHISA